MSIVYLSLGSNKGNRENYLFSAIELLNSKVGNITKISDIWESESWNYSDNDYLNVIVELYSNVKAQEILNISQEIEKELGRKGKTQFVNGIAKYYSRIIDIDILFFDNKIINLPNLKIPHSNLHLRMFVLKPFLQIASEFVHPVFQKNIKELVQECTDNGQVEIFETNFQKTLFSKLQNFKK